MGKYLNLIGNETTDSPIGQKVLQRLRLYRAMGVTHVNGEEVAQGAYFDFMNDVQRVETELAQLKAKQAAREIRSSLPVNAGRSASVLRDSRRTVEDDDIREGGDIAPGVYSDEREAARHPWR